MSNVLADLKFANTDERDRVINERWPKRECSDVPGVYDLPNGNILSVMHLEVKEFQAQCEVCGDTTSAVEMVDRKWEDGTMDLDVKVCEAHSVDDEDGMFQLYNHRKLSDL